MLTAVATKSLKIVIFNHLMVVDANCDDSVTIPRCPNLVVNLKVSVALKKNFRVLTRAFWAPPYFKSWIHPWDQKAETIARLFVEGVVCRHGAPEELLSDRGTNFLSNLVLEVCMLFDVKKLNTSGYHPQTNGLCECFNTL